MEWDSVRLSMLAQSTRHPHLTKVCSDRRGLCAPSLGLVWVDAHGRLFRRASRRAAKRNKAHILQSRWATTGRASPRLSDPRAYARRAARAVAARQHTDVVLCLPHADIRSLLFAACYLLPAARCTLPVACCLVLAIRQFLLAPYCLLRGACSLLLAACCLILTACCVLVDTCCLLLDTYYLLRAT